MRSRFLFALATLALMVTACSEPIGNPSCARNDECTSGRLCDPSGACVVAEPLAVRARSLPDALVGDPDYSVALQAEGGIPPYEWSMVPDGDSATALAWLEIDATTGELRCITGQSPATAQQDLQITVTVKDHSEAGTGNAASRPFDLNISECNGAQTCYEPSGGACQQGVRSCNDGVLSECAIDGPSIDLEHCGQTCGPCSAGSNQCLAGQCRCGDAAPCAEGEACCGQGCFNLLTTQTHCGACDHDCTSAAAHTLDTFCTIGLCDYTQCDPGYLDCNDVRADGCETQSNLDNCSACGDACTNTNTYLHTANQECQAGQCAFDCIPGYDDCDLDLSDGCEQPLSALDNCGQCGRDCTGSNAGFLCLETDTDVFNCGCETDAECLADRMCCGGVCVPHTVNHCPDCDTGCSILTGGLDCNSLDATTWECECTDDDSCRGDYPFSRAACGLDNQCFCDTQVDCAGSVTDMCCLNQDNSKSCKILSSDPENCGSCGKACANGHTCSDGACTCAAGEPCPANSGAPLCDINGHCVCGAYGDGTEPCYPGQLCCPGDGCCVGSCQSGSCSDGCQGVWCWDGCCPLCGSEADCTPMPG